jgi:predicted metal-dependent enzyme (double-stranded beta helix superfamily)
MVAIWPTGRTTGVHDHAGKWVVEGVYRNTLHTVRYRRLDDRLRPRYAELRETAVFDLYSGDVSHVLSPDQDIHGFTNTTDTPMVSMHIYGGDISSETRNHFDPAAKTVTQVTQEIHYDNE